MEAFMGRFTAAATEEWYAPHDPDEVEREERNCMRLVQQPLSPCGRVQIAISHLCTLSITIICRTEHGVEVELVYLKRIERI